MESGKHKPAAQITLLCSEAAKSGTLSVAMLVTKYLLTDGVLLPCETSQNSRTEQQ